MRKKIYQFLYQFAAKVKRYIFFEIPILNFDTLTYQNNLFFGKYGTQFPSAIAWRKKSTSYNHKTTIWVSHY